MIKVIVHGSNGKMGGHVIEALKKSSSMELFCGVDAMSNGNEDYKHYSSFDQIEGRADVIIDFSFYTVVKNALDYAVATG
ncbi:MAG: 4-hydroxy-tetrahydrodipicolinate reductase, partial [Clostridia bacterium]|nr:4-hydroxy-tetrahydrodipicolinate reductase [Clostridia bacterium]